MRGVTRKRKPRESQVHRFPAPTAGLISNRNLAMAASGPPGAAVMRNFFPTATGCVLRRGLEAQTDIGAPVEAMFSYVNGAQNDFFAATSSQIFRISGSPVSVASGKTSGGWSVVQFATAGGVFLIAVNGADEAIQYDGVTWSATSITFPAGAGVSTSDLAFVWAYKQRLWFIQKDSLDAWYLPVDSIGGQLTKLPLGGVFTLGGELQWGQAWSLYSGGAGGLSEQCVFVTTEGEVAAYQGANPSSATDWAKVGTYRTGRPMGRRAFVRAGGDLLIATTVGLVSLAAASQADYAALGRLAVSHPIEDEWAQAVRQRGETGWVCETWPNGQMITVCPPFSGTYSPVVFATNTNTGGWCEFTGWEVSAARAFDGFLYIGNSAGVIAQAWAGGLDLGNSYVGELVPLFSDLGMPASRKFPKLGRVTYRSTGNGNERLTAVFEYRSELPPPPDSNPSENGAVWGSAAWGDAVWGETASRDVFSVWRGVGGSGSMVSIGIQITSGDTVPLDAVVISIDLAYTSGDIVT